MKKFFLMDKQTITKLYIFLAVSLLLFFIDDIQPLINIDRQILHEETQLKISLTTLPTLLPTLKSQSTYNRFYILNDKQLHEKKDDEKEMLSDLTNDLHINNLAIANLQWKEIKSANTDRKLQVTLIGSFTHFAKFMVTSQARPYDMHLHTLTYHTNENHDAIIQADLSIVAKSLIDKTMLNNHAQLLPLHSYFCEPVAQPVPGSSTFSINEFKMVGFLSQHQHMEALVTLPNQDLIILSQGMIVGQEKARVLMVSSHSVKLQLPNQTIYYLQKP